MRAMLWLGSVVVALAVVIGAGRLWAENKEPKPAKAEKATKPTAPRTHIALVNLTYVIKNYSKYKQFQDELKTAIKPLEERQQKLRARAEKLRQRKEDKNILPAKADDLEEAMTKLQRDKEDFEAKANKLIGKKSDEGMKILYTDVVEAVKRYAVAHDFDLVMHYNDATTAEEFVSVQNIARKLNTGALLPMYSTSGMDISKEVLNLLNYDVKTD